MDYDQVHAFFVWVCPVKESFCEAVDNYPLTLAVVATLEILAKWERFGISISEVSWNDDCSLVSQLLERCDILQQAVQRIPTLSHGHDLLLDLANKRTTRITSNSVFKDVWRCHGPDCCNTNVSTCSGCKSAFNCGAEHQKQDWKTHKAFCKAVRAAE